MQLGSLLPIGIGAPPGKQSTRSIPRDEQDSLGIGQLGDFPRIEHVHTGN